jgi:hypothetical protein
MPTTTKFGLSQLANETPQIAKVVAQLTVYAVGVVNVALLSFPQIPASVKANVAGYSGGALLFVNSICHMFGIQVTNPTYTPPKQ